MDQYSDRNISNLEERVRLLRTRLDRHYKNLVLDRDTSAAINLIKILEVSHESAVVELARCKGDATEIYRIQGKIEAYGSILAKYYSTLNNPKEKER